MTRDGVTVPHFDPDLDELPPELRWREWMARVEAVIFAAPAPVPREALSRLVGRNCRLDEILADIRAELAARPYDLVFVAGGWTLRTRPQLADAIKFADAIPGASGPRLTPAEQLVLAVIAYHQPITRTELSRSCGKEVGRDLIGRLRDQDLIAAGPRAPEPGAPFTYVTTEAFLTAFGLGSLRDLPNLEALEEAGLLTRATPSAGAQQILDTVFGVSSDDNAEAIDQSDWPGLDE